MPQYISTRIYTYRLSLPRLLYAAGPQNGRHVQAAPPANLSLLHGVVRWTRLPGKGGLIESSSYETELPNRVNIPLFIPFICATSLCFPTCYLSIIGSDKIQYGMYKVLPVCIQFANILSSQAAQVISNSGHDDMIVRLSAFSPNHQPTKVTC